MLKSGSLCLMSIAAVILTGCPLPPYGDAPPHGCQGPGCWGDDDDDDDDGCGGWAGSGGYGGGGGYAGGGGKAGSGGAGGGLPQRSPISLDEYQQRLRLDLATISRAEQAEVVYVDFHAAYNNHRYSDDEMGAFANATLKLINQLDVFSVTANRTGGVVITDDFNRPIAVRFTPARFNLDKQRDILDTVARLGHRQDVNDPFFCEVPAIPVLDFLHIASSDDVFDPIFGTFESGYANIALRQLLVKEGLLSPEQLVFSPISEGEFIANGFTNLSNVGLYDLLAAVDPINFNRQALDVVYNEGSDIERLVRGCLLNSNVSAANRCVDRLQQSSPFGGATYLSFDVLSFTNPSAGKDFFEAAFVGPGNPPGDPLVRPQDGHQPFQVDGGTGIFQLQNSMLGFFGFNANFQLVSNALPYNLIPGDIESGGFVSSAACNSCHSSFTIPFEDAMLPTIFGAPNSENFSYALKRAQTQDDWDATFDIDAVFYAETLRNVYFVRPEDGSLPDGIWALGVQYKNDLSFEDVVAELGLFDVETLIDRLDNTGLGGEFIGGGISRESFTVNYQAFVEQIASSNEDFLRGCVAREAPDGDDFPDGDDDGDGDDGN